MDWLTNLLGSWGTTGNTTVGNSPIPLSTPVNTSANPNNSGSWFSGVLNTLSSLGGDAASVYKTYTTADSTNTAAKTAAATATSTSNTVKMLVIGGVVIGGIVLLVSLFRRK